jgi:hypothetical protein
VLREVAFPDLERLEPPEDGPVPLVEPGTFTVDPSHAGEVSGSRGEGFVLHPDEVHGVRAHDDPMRSSGCCALDGLDGPNLVCASCGSEVATLTTDCWVYWSSVRLHTDAVRADVPV